ncbi:radical SAM protein [Candidatus Parcubacteria bacterium]|nr:radical SAM protein [Candidatus Parcubacteria bacterium]
MITLDVQITNRCNYECEYCYSLSNHKEMGEETYSKVIEIAKLLNINAIEFCGGEPLLHSKFEKFTKIAKDFNLILRTNGILLNRFNSLISKYYSWVCISLDGLENENDIMKKSRTIISSKDKFEIPISNIKVLKKLNPNLKVLIGSLVSKLNYKNILKLGNYLVENKIPIDVWKLYLFRPKFARAKLNEEKFILSETEFDKLKFDKLKTLFQKGSKNGGECLIVAYDGNILLGNKIISNIYEPHDKILKSVSKFIAKVSENKTITYI